MLRLFGGAYSDGLDVKIDQDGAVAAGEWQREMVHELGQAYMSSSPSTDFANGLRRQYEEKVL